MDKVKNVMFAGIGGQGIIRASDMLTEAAFRMGFDVKKSELHGMSQRGGSVSSEVRFGKSVASPMVPEGESDLLVILEPTQVEVNIAKLRKDGILITTEDIPLAELPHPKAANMMMLGALSKHFDLPEELWIKHMHRNLPEKVHAVNDEAFRIGRNGKDAK